MRQSPFSVLQPFADHLNVHLFLKEDHIQTDADVARALGVPRVTSLHQAHGNVAVRITKHTSRTIKADGMATDIPGMTLSIRSADCQSFVVYAPSKNVCGVLHVGWRSLEAGMIASFYDLLKREWDITPEETYVGAGPSLGKECSEFTDPHRELPHVPKDLIDGRHADLMETAERQFDALGVPRSHRERIAECTKCNPDLYYSYRGVDREGVLNGFENVLTCRLI